MKFSNRLAHWIAREQDTVELLMYAAVILAAAIWWASLGGG